MEKFWFRVEIALRFVPLVIFFGIGIPASQFDPTNPFWFLTMIGLVVVSVVVWEFVQRFNTKKFGSPTY